MKWQHPNMCSQRAAFSASLFHKVQWQFLCQAPRDVTSRCKALSGKAHRRSRNAKACSRLKLALLTGSQAPADWHAVVSQRDLSASEGPQPLLGSLYNF